MNIINFVKRVQIAILFSFIPIFSLSNDSIEIGIISDTLYLKSDKTISIDIEITNNTSSNLILFGLKRTGISFLMHEEFCDRPYRPGMALYIEKGNKHYIPPILKGYHPSNPRVTAEDVRNLLRNADSLSRIPDFIEKHSSLILHDIVFDVSEIYNTHEDINQHNIDCDLYVTYYYNRKGLNRIIDPKEQKKIEHKNNAKIYIPCDYAVHYSDTVTLITKTK